MVWRSTGTFLYSVVMDNDHELSPKEEARQDMHREQSEQRWRTVLQEAERGRHVSLNHLCRLARLGIPEFAGPYAADRFSGKIAPTGHPTRPPLDPRDLDTLWDHFTPQPNADEKDGIARLVPVEFAAVREVRRRHARYKALATTREPRRTNKPRMIYNASRGVWTVKDPKREARAKVAPLWNVDPTTLEKWEGRVRAWKRRVQDAFPLTRDSVRKLPPKKDRF